MTISELIAALEALKTEHGDLPVYVTEDGFEFETYQVDFDQHGIGHPKGLPDRIVIYGM